MDSCLLAKARYLSFQLSNSKSPTRMPFRPVLSMYVGPIPLRVDPILAFPLDASEAASNKRCVGKIKCALREITKDFL